MEPVKVGIREFRENLASYVLAGGKPVAITRHGGTVGYFIPTRRKLTAEQWAELKSATSRLSAIFDEIGMSEDDVIADFKKWRANRRK